MNEIAFSGDLSKGMGLVARKLALHLRWQAIRVEKVRMMKLMAG